MTWFDSVQEIADFHSDKVRIYGPGKGGRPKDGKKSGWGIQDTASFFKVSLRTANLCIRLRKFISRFPELKALASKKQAIRIMLEFEK